MSRTFLISDTHFGHEKCYTEFQDDINGGPMRPWASNSVDGDEYMVDRWNSVVGDNDLVYHLGDVAIPKRGIAVLGRLNGRKKLVKGNHDHYSLKEYTPYFEDIMGAYRIKEFFLTHIPVHPEHIRYGGNIHGHLHSNRVVTVNRGMKDPEYDPRYRSVCVEQIDVTPIDFEQVREEFKNTGVI